MDPVDVCACMTVRQFFYFGLIFGGFWRFEKSKQVPGEVLDRVIVRFRTESGRVVVICQDYLGELGEKSVNDLGFGASTELSEDHSCI